jgi:hypothetical protein
LFVLFCLFCLFVCFVCLFVCLSAIMDTVHTEKGDVNVNILESFMPSVCTCSFSYPSVFQRNRRGSSGS